MQILPGVNLKDLITFSTYADAILGNNFTNCRIISVLDAEDAALLSPIKSQHASVYPFLPKDGTVINDAYSYDYCRVQLNNGEKVVLGLPWINLDTVSLVENEKMTLEFEGTARTSLDQILTILQANGVAYTRLQ